LKNDPYSLASLKFLSERWQVSEDDIVVLSIVNGRINKCATIYLLNTLDMSEAKIYFPLPEVNKADLFSGYVYQIKPPLPVDTSLGSAYLVEENIPKSSTEKQIIYNYYAGKYKWVGPIRYDIMVEADIPKSILKDSHLRIGHAMHILFLGLPLNILNIEFFY
jgi:hypothetical protein